MASSTLRAGIEAQTGGVVLPIDVIYEILIRLPAEGLCRLRVVCRAWKTLLSDAPFCHRRTLIVEGSTKSYSCGILCRIIDLSGRAIKYIRAETNEWLISTQCNLACVAIGTLMQCRLINLVTVERFSLPRGLSREHTPRRLEFLKCRVSVAFGHVASTGEFKLLRVIDKKFDTVPCEQICEVLTYGGSRSARWRGKKAAQDRVLMSPRSRVVIDGVVYFLLGKYVSGHDVRPKDIASFDLLTEEWRPILRQPDASMLRRPDASMLAKNRRGTLSLAALNGSLVLVHCSPCFSMDLWFLMDFGKGLWVKQHTVEINLTGNVDFFAHPLVTLKDGSIVIYIRYTGFLKNYNPRTNTCTDAARLGYLVGEIGLYTGNLLSIANDAIQ